MKATYRWSILLILILLFVLAWLVLDSVSPHNPLRDALAQVAAPLQLVVKRGLQPLSGALDWFASKRALQQENEALRRENAELRAQLVLLHEARIENESLRQQLAFKSAVPNYQLLAAEVVGRDPGNYFRYLVIDRGAEDGIRRGMPVLTEAGLVGRIDRVSRNAAQVMLITDPSSSVSALIQRSRATGVVQGDLESQLVMRYLSPNETVLPGDVVLTSGLGGNFPKRLLIGQVVEVHRDDVQMFQEAIVAPAVDLRSLESVMVLLNYFPPVLEEQP